MRAMLVLFVVCLVAGCEDKPAGKGGGATTPPKAGAPAKFKNATELGAYLNKNGIKGNVGVGGLYDKPERPCSSFFPPGDLDSEILIYHCKTEADAEEFVGTAGNTGFRYGRFVIVRNGPSHTVYNAAKKLLR